MNKSVLLSVCQDHDAGLLFFEPALKSFAKDKIPSFSGSYPGVILADMQAESEAEGFCFMARPRGGAESAIGLRSGRLEVLAYDSAGKEKCIVRCDCGTIKTVWTGGIRSGKQRSCGCARNNNRGQGITDYPEYQSWRGMRERVLSPNHQSHEYYANVTIFPAWVKDFMAFYRYVGPRPTPQHTIDRYPNPDGNYEPGNVRWATRREQNNNRRPRRWKKRPANA